LEPQSAMESSLKVLYEDNHLIIVNKRAGDLVQGDRTGDTTLADDVKAYIKVKYEKPGDVYLGIIHRLARPVSGAVMYARTSKALERMNRQFKERAVRKTYWAAVKEFPNDMKGTLKHFLVRNQNLNKSFVSKASADGAKQAILHYNYKCSSDTYHLLEVNLETGRHHQIRAQLAAMGSPIKGDVKYGFDRGNRNGSIHLHARKLSFEHPVKKEPIEVIAPPPDDPVWNELSKG